MTGNDPENHINPLETNNNDLNIVLVRPMFSGNLGAILRSAKNFGIKNISLVSPMPMDWDSVNRLAVHAKELIPNLKFYDSLENAIENCSLVIGTSARTNGQKSSSMSIYGDSFKKISSVMLSSNTAILMGSEENGLTNQELSCCDITIHIPACLEQPSMNLSHACSTIFSYIYYLKTKLKKPKTLNSKPVNINDKSPLPNLSKKETAVMLEKFKTVLKKTGFINPQNPEIAMKEIRKIIFKSSLNHKQSCMIMGVLSKILKKIV